MGRGYRKGGIIDGRPGGGMRGASAATEVKQIDREDLVLNNPSDAIASDLHDDWRESRKLPDGTYEPRIKTTADQEWIAANGTDEVDIANTSFESLPSDWQAENSAAAEAAIDAYLSTDDREAASSAIHDAWLERNGEWAEEHQRLPYAELSEEEKEKDRVQFDLAQKIFREQKAIVKQHLETDLNNRQNSINAIASDLHDDWRESRKLPDGTYEPRIKTTADQEWIAANGTDEVDIANTSFESLPSDWQAENSAAAEAAIDAVLTNRNLEAASSAIHDAWLERNGEWAEEHQRLPYAELSEEEKEKDRVQARAAIAASSGNLSLVEENDPRGLAEGTILGVRQATEAERIISSANYAVETAKARLSSDRKKTQEAEAIAKYATQESKKTGQDPSEIIKDIEKNYSLYEDRIPEIAQNSSDHSGASWAATISGAHSFANNGGKDSESAQEYFDKQEREIRKAEIVQKMKQRAVKEVTTNLKSDAEQLVTRAEYRASSAQSFTLEAQAIATYAKQVAQQDGRTESEIIEDINNRPSAYESVIPQVAANSNQHSGSSWSMTINGALGFANNQESAVQSANEYIQNERKSLARTKKASEMQKRYADKILAGIS